MAARAFCIRHAQSYFNIQEKLCDERHESYDAINADPTLIDPDITDKGFQQIEEARPLVHSIAFDKVYVSPLKRALKTCKLLFSGHPTHPTIKVLPDITEHLEAADAFSSPSTLSDPFFDEFDWSSVDRISGYWLFDLVDNSTTRSIRAKGERDMWPEIGCSVVPEGLIESTDELIKRAERVKEILKADLQLGLTVAIVSHWFFITQLTMREGGVHEDLPNVGVADITELLQPSALHESG